MVRNVSSFKTCWVPRQLHLSCGLSIIHTSIPTLEEINEKFGSNYKLFEEATLFQNNYQIE